MKNTHVLTMGNTVMGSFGRPSKAMIWLNRFTDQAHWWNVDRNGDYRDGRYAIIALEHNPVAAALDTW